MKGGYFLEDFDNELEAKNDSPKSAHHAMGLEAADYNTDEEGQRSPNKEDYGNTEEE